MSTQLIVVIVFFSIVAVMMFLSRNATLDKLAMIPGESILFEEDKVKVTQNGSPKSAVFINSIVRVTNFRIIIAQKFLRGNKYALRHVITYDQNFPHSDEQNKSYTGYLSFSINKMDVKMDTSEQGDQIKIALPESGLTKGQSVSFNLNGFVDFKKIFFS